MSSSHPTNPSKIPASTETKPNLQTPTDVASSQADAASANPEATSAQTDAVSHEADAVSHGADAVSHGADVAAPASQPAFQSAQRSLMMLLLQPVFVVAGAAVFFAVLGLFQRMGWIGTAGSHGNSHAQQASGAQNTLYICPMMCTPPSPEPGRCPVCGMELVPSSSTGAHQDFHAVHIEPAARRIANIQTVAVSSVPTHRTVKAIGDIQYDEGGLKTLSAYVDGRIDKLYADYTGIEVKKDDRLALLYSPRLYSSQVEFLLAKESYLESQSSTLRRVVQSNQDLYENSRQRLIELGMTNSQVKQLEEKGEASSRMYLNAPISGTVIKKLTAEGQYVKEGQAIYQLADLSTVWLMLRLFPEDAALIRYGQKVDAEVQSLPGEKLTGRVAFIDPNVDPKTRTVGIRVVIGNDDGAIRVGDYAKASIHVPLMSEQQTLVYDPELAGKWISPRHPNIVRSEPGPCPICGVDLVPAAQFGFADHPIQSGHALAVPRNAVLMAGGNSVVYVETEPGRFELRNVVLGPVSDDQISILSGVVAGERVATKGNFLIDSQMQLTGNPSLIDPMKVQPQIIDVSPKTMLASLSALSAEDQKTAQAQETCPVTGLQLGKMGTPVKVDVQGKPVFICCKACRTDLLSKPEKYLDKLSKSKHSPHETVKESSDSHLPPMGAMELVEPTRSANRSEDGSSGRVIR